jgi:hypothetical protein
MPTHGLSLITSAPHDQQAKGELRPVLTAGLGPGKTPIMDLHAGCIRHVLALRTTVKKPTQIAAKKHLFASNARGILPPAAPHSESRSDFLRILPNMTNARKPALCQVSVDWPGGGPGTRLPCPGRGRHDAGGSGRPRPSRRRNAVRGVHRGPGSARGLEASRALGRVPGGPPARGPT